MPDTQVAGDLSRGRSRLVTTDCVCRLLSIKSLASNSDAGFSEHLPNGLLAELPVASNRGERRTLFICRNHLFQVLSMKQAYSRPNWRYYRAPFIAPRYRLTEISRTLTTGRSA